MWVLRFFQVLVGLILMAESLKRRSFILKKFYGDSLHPAHRLLAFAGGLVLLILGIWGELPTIW